MTATARRDIVTMSDNSPSIVFFDIETTGLSAKAGDIILSCAFIEHKEGASPTVIGNLECPDDFDIAVDIASELRKYDRVIGWNSHGFDMKFINDRLRIHGYPLLLHRGSFDMKDWWKAMFPYMDGHQDTALRAIDAKHQKTPLDIEQNRRLGRNEGTKEDWAELIHHNIEDILGLQELYVFGLESNAS